MSKVSSLARARKGNTLKAKMRELIDSRPALQNLITQPLPATTAFRLARLVQALNPELEAYEVTRKKLCEQHGTLDTESNTYKFEPAAQAVFAKEMDALLDSEVEIAGEKVRLDFLSQAHLSVVDALNLQWLIAAE
jgi:hypothetical protein